MPVFGQGGLPRGVGERVEQAPAQIAASHTGRVQLTHYFQGLLQIRGGESWLVGRHCVHGGLGCGGDRGGGISGSRGKRGFRAWLGGGRELGSFAVSRPGVLYGVWINILLSIDRKSVV